MYKIEIFRLLLTQPYKNEPVKQFHIVLQLFQKRSNLIFKQVSSHSMLIESIS